MQPDQHLAKKIKINCGKPLLFDLLPHCMGTEGDRKPLFILAILAARSGPVTILLHNKSRDSCMTKFAEYLGVTSNINFVNPPKMIEGLPIEEYLQYFKDLRSQFFSIAAGSSSWMDSNECDLILNFGDNGGPNRFVTKLLTESGCVSFTSLCLPMDKECPMWSKDSDVKTLQEFCTFSKSQNRKIMLLAGSLCPTFDFQQVFQWIETSNNKKWSFIIIAKLDRIAPRYYASKELMTKYVYTSNDDVLHFENIEYEDVLRFVDFSVGNGGAGSIYTSLACGVPQSVGYAIKCNDLSGSDKNTNCRFLQKLKLGPPTTEGGLVYNRKVPRMIVNFDTFMEDVTRNLSIYSANAIIYKEVCKQEFQDFNLQCDDSFKVLRTEQGQLDCGKKKQDEETEFGLFPRI